MILYFIIFWPPNGIPVYAGDSSQVYPLIVNDTLGGVYIAWSDNRSGEYDIYAQRIDSTGNLCWFPEGRVICDAPGHQFCVQAVNDTRGGAILCWLDARSNNNFDLYAQRVDENGNLLWPQSGAIICNAPSSQFFLTAVSDANGGIIAAWQDYRGLDNDIYVQHLDSLGNILWQSSGMPICIAPGHQERPVIIGLNNNRYLVIWEDKRNGDYDLYGQILDQNGTIYWQENGKKLCYLFANQFSPRTVSVDTNDFIVVWEDCRNGDIDLYAQKFNYNGDALWDSNGVGIGLGLDYQRDAQLVPDGLGGIFISWEDGRQYPSLIHCQHLNGEGTKLWGEDGIIVTPPTWLFHYPRMVSNGMGGVLIQWSWVNGEETYAQNLDSLGNFLWPDPVPVCTLKNNSELKIVSDGMGGFYSTWQHVDSNIDIDIYLQRIYGNTGISEKDVQKTYNFMIFPSPFKNHLTIKFAPPNSQSEISLKIYDVSGRLVKQFNHLTNYQSSVVWCGDDMLGRKLPQGIYFVRLEADGSSETKKVVLMR